MASGRVKWFNESQGYGYIEDNNTGLDVYMHIASLEGQRIPKQNSLVHYDLIETRYGLEAMRVQLQEYRR